MQLSLTWTHVGVGGFTPLYPFERPRQNGSFRIGTTILCWVYSTDPRASDLFVCGGSVSEIFQGRRGLRHKKHQWYEACNDPKLSEIGYIMLNHLEPATKNQRDYPPIRMFSNIGDTEHWSWSMSSRYYLFQEWLSGVFNKRNSDEQTGYVCFGPENSQNDTGYIFHHFYTFVHIEASDFTSSGRAASGFNPCGEPDW